MSFATIEEAWGVPRFSAGNAPADHLDRDRHDRDQDRSQDRGQGRGRDDHRRGGGGHQRRRDPSRPGGSFPRAFDSADDGFAPPVDAPPRSEAEDTDAENTRRFLARTYARYGVPGLLRVMPREALPHFGGARRRGPGLWGAVVRALSKPEHVLFVLVALFALVVLWDALARPAAAAAVQPSLASLHMSPFPLGTSSM